MDQKDIPVYWGSDREHLVGTATFKDGWATMEVTDPRVIAAITGTNSLSGYSIGSVDFNKEKQVVSNSEFTFDFNVDLSGKSIEDINMLRRALMRELSFLKRKNEKNYKRGEEVKPTRKILIMEEVLDQLWQQLVEARAARHEVNGREV